MTNTEIDKINFDELVKITHDGKLENKTLHEAPLSPMQIAALITSGVVPPVAFFGYLVSVNHLENYYTLVFFAQFVAVASWIGLPILTYSIISSYQKKNFLKYKNSKNVAKRNHYFNSIIIQLIQNNPSHHIFKKRTFLEYALWLERKHEKMRYSYRRNKKFMEKMNYGKFQIDPDSEKYSNVARAMIQLKIKTQKIPDASTSMAEVIVFRNAGFEVKALKPDTKIRITQLTKAVSSSETRVETQVALPLVVDYSNELRALAEVERKWNATQLDIVHVLKYPMFADMSNPFASDFNVKLRFAQSLSKKNLDIHFVQAIAELEIAFGTLEQEAIKTEISNFSEGEQKRIVMARDLIDIAMSGVSSPSERQSAYKRAMEQLKGLLLIPEAAVSILDNVVNKKELTS